jgi:hypothetical protein
MDPFKKNPAAGLRIDRDFSLRNLVRSITVHESNKPDESTLEEILFRKRMAEQVVIQGFRNLASRKKSLTER